MKLFLKRSIVFCALTIVASYSQAQTAKDILDRAKNTTVQQQTPTPKKPVESTEQPSIEDQIFDGNISNQLLAYSSTGTGFYIDGEGRFITAAHVVTSCNINTFKIRGFDKNVYKAEILTVDRANDLALLRVKNLNSKAVKLNLTPQLGEDAYAFGYPLYGELAQSGNFTSGIVTSLSGYKEDTTKFQLSAPVQAGNSGGPVFDQKGNVIGLVLLKKNLNLNQNQIEVIQNVNFALRSRLIEIFLTSNGIRTELSKDDDTLLSKTEIAAKGQASSVLVYCLAPQPKKKEGEK